LIISSINFSAYRIPFIQPLTTAKGEISFREGIIIELKSGIYSGYGETAPLPGFSKEILIEARNCLEGFSLAIKGIEENQSLEDLLILAKAQSFENPSALFGLETAIYDLYSKINMIPFWKNFSNKSCDFITVNGLEKDMQSDINYQVYKIKLTDKNIFIIKEKLNVIQNKIGRDKKIRIDANESLDLPRAIRLCRELEEFNIEYIEQPLPKEKLEDLAELRLHTEIPIALDESLTDINSAREIIEYQSADIFVIKPMITGNINECLEIINLGNKHNIKSVITTTLGTEIEKQVCIHLAFSSDIKLANGFSANSLLESDIVKNPIQTSIINKPIKPGLNLTPEKIPYQ